MQVIISGKHLDVGNSLREYTEEKLQEHVKKYFEHAINAHVTLSKEGTVYKVDILVNEGTGTGTILKSNAEEYDPYKSFDAALERMTKQLRRYKTKIKNHKKRKLDKTELIDGTKYVISSTQEEEEENIGDAPTIIAEKPTNLELLSVGDAVMRMDLLNLPALVFINSSSRNFSVVYYRKDGNISWVDTKISV